MTKNIGHVNGLPVASDLLGLAAVYQPRHLQCLSLSLSVCVCVCQCLSVSRSPHTQHRRAHKLTRPEKFVQSVHRLQRDDAV